MKSKMSRNIILIALLGLLSIDKVGEDRFIANTDR